jgi:hypothetical protein
MKVKMVFFRALLPILAILFLALAQPVSPQEMRGHVFSEDLTNLCERVTIHGRLIHAWPSEKGNNIKIVWEEIKGEKRTLYRIEFHRLDFFAPSIFGDAGKRLTYISYISAFCRRDYSGKFAQVPVGPPELFLPQR